jgi:hypothetical protein
VDDAVGLRIYDLPITAEKVLIALKTVAAKPTRDLSRRNRARSSAYHGI